MIERFFYRSRKHRFDVVRRRGNRRILQVIPFHRLPKTDAVHFFPDVEDFFGSVSEKSSRVLSDRTEQFSVRMSSVDHASCAVIALRDDSLKILVIQRMIFNHDSSKSLFPP